jgi:hypothetical protein
LIIAQFATSVILIAGTIIVFQQVSFMRHQPLGANINQTLILDGAASVRDSAYESVFSAFQILVTAAACSQNSKCFDECNGKGNLLDQWHQAS